MKTKMKKFNLFAAGILFIACVFVFAFVSGTAAQGESSNMMMQPAGDPDKGKNLFIGEMRFANGGPPCMACHSISGISALGGGALGPDLTTTASGFDLGYFFTNIPSKTMKPIFSKHTLTPEEIGHLKVFFTLAAAGTLRPIQAVQLLTILAVAGAAILILLAHLFWVRRLNKVRQPMVKKSKI